MLVPEVHADALPEALDDVTAAPLLCSGIVGVSGTAAGRGGDRPGATVHVLTRSRAARSLADLAADRVDGAAGLVPDVAGRPVAAADGPGPRR